MNFNRHCLIENNISIPKKSKNQFISYTLTKSLVNKFKHRFFVR